MRELERLGKHYWLFGGTLLGWYRDCGIIPHTTDMDVAVRASQLDSPLVDAFRGKPKLPLTTAFGRRNDSFEMRAQDANAQIDIFYLNLDYLCSAPCDPVGFLNREYGSMEMWAKPKAGDYTWLSLDANFKFKRFCQSTLN